MKNSLREILGSEHPVIQGAMGFVSNPELVAAVSGAGGFGQLATIFLEDIEELRRQVRRVKALTSRPFGANLFAKQPLSIDFARVLAEEGVRTVTFSGGSPKKIAPLLNDLGINFIAVTATVRGAVSASESGAAAVVAEGSESGGVQGYRGSSTLVLVPQVADAVDIPVVAAGGISDGRSYRAALALGASGVQVGTRFIATKECIAHPTFKEAIVKADDTSTEVVDLGSFCLRALVTKTVELISKSELDPSALFVPEKIRKGWIGGELEAGLFASGQVAGAIKSIKTVREVIMELIGEP
ncbi:MAG: nitronate monooxygenase [Deltaproteobacteria bacterium]|nr:MAG: nitronate monooxygenase [Deltaproteobacteria bacterium]